VPHTTPTLTENASSSERYWWRVRAIDDSAEGAWSATGSFRIDTSDPAPGSVAYAENPASDYVHVPQSGTVYKIYYNSTESYSATVTATVSGASDSLSGLKRALVPGSVLGITDRDGEGYPGAFDTTINYTINAGRVTTDYTGGETTVYDNVDNSALCTNTLNIEKYIPPKPILFAKQGPGDTGSAITEGTWQCDNDPYIYWSHDSEIFKEYTLEVSGATTIAETSSPTGGI
ncbi:unnamed protein product, partial [marine sediment metagenome]